MTNEQFELLAELYYRRYGRLYPGKDEPVAMGRDSSDPENIQQVIDWKGGPMVSPAMRDLLTEILRVKSQRDALAEALQRVDQAEWLDMQVTRHPLLVDVPELYESPEGYFEAKPFGDSAPCKAPDSEETKTDSQSRDEYSNLFDLFEACQELLAWCAKPDDKTKSDDEVDVELATILEPIREAVQRIENENESAETRTDNIATFINCGLCGSLLERYVPLGTYLILKCPKGCAPSYEMLFGSPNLQSQPVRANKKEVESR